MPVRAARIAKALLIAALFLAPPVAHLALIMNWGMGLAGVLVALQAVIVSWVASSPVTSRALRAAICGAVFLLVLWLWRFTDGGPVAASAVPHAMANMALLAFFLASLAPGRESVATMLARRSRGHLSAALERYTRRVTWFWCWFFVGQLAASLLLLLFAPLNVWSLFVNFCNFPLLIVMLSAEYVYRQWRHPAQPPERLIDMVRIYRGMRTAPAPEDL
jgi:uncharacterized membrane protein